MKTAHQDNPPDLVTAEPEQTKVLLENERVRVLDVRVAAGQKQRMHSHPDHLVYPLSAYRMKHIAEDGSASIGERRSGEVVWIPAESHAGENVGETECHVLIVELKRKPTEQNALAPEEPDVYSHRRLLPTTSAPEERNVLPPTVTRTFRSSELSSLS